MLRIQPMAASKGNTTASKQKSLESRKLRSAK
jgi:hypothetical protein